MAIVKTFGRRLLCARRVQLKMHSDTHSSTPNVEPLAEGVRKPSKTDWAAFPSLRISSPVLIIVPCDLVYAYTGEELIASRIQKMTRSMIPRNVSTDMSRIPTPNLPPPYTWTGARAGQLRHVL